jgi:hypothetical protein
MWHDRSSGDWIADCSEASRTIGFYIDDEGYERAVDANKLSVVRTFGTTCGGA